MDVLCVGMYRACSTWQYEVVAHLLERHRGGTRLGYLTGDQYAALGPAPAGAWRVLKSHEEHASFARKLRNGQAIAIYAHRDVRDVVYSLMHKRKVSFGATLRAGMIHQVLVNDRFWARQPLAITQRYDFLVAEPVAGVRELAAVLGLDLDPGEAERVAAEYSFQANRERAEKLGRQLREGGVDLADPRTAQAHDGRTLLHWNHLREGRVNDWQDRATPEERRVLDRVCGRWLKAHGYEPDSAIAAVRDPAGRAASREWELARGALACRLRTLSLRHPKLARVAKRVLGIAPDAPLAQPAKTPPPLPLPAGVRHDGAGGLPAPAQVEASDRATRPR